MTDDATIYDELGGPVLPLYLNHDETLALALAVDLLMRLSEAATRLNSHLTAHIEQAEGAAGVARLDQVTARARERLPLLHSLRTALAEHGYALEAELDRLRQRP